MLPNTERSYLTHKGRSYLTHARATKHRQELPNTDRSYLTHGEATKHSERGKIKRRKGMLTIFADDWGCSKVDTNVFGFFKITRSTYCEVQIFPSDLWSEISESN